MSVVETLKQNVISLLTSSTYPILLKLFCWIFFYFHLHVFVGYKNIERVWFDNDKKKAMIAYFTTYYKMWFFKPMNMCSFLNLTCVYYNLINID